jgi:hypothetical protein
VSSCSHALCILFFSLLCSVHHVHSMRYSCACSSLCQCSALGLFTTSPLPHNMAHKRIKKLFFVMHLFYTPIPLHDHHGNSLSSLAVMLNVFIISGHYPEIPWLLWKSQLFVIPVSYNQSSLAYLSSKPLPSCDHRR